jgi:hypothetical protein
VLPNFASPQNSDASLASSYWSSGRLAANSFWISACDSLVVVVVFVVVDVGAAVLFAAAFLVCAVCSWVAADVSTPPPVATHHCS